MTAWFYSIISVLIVSIVSLAGVVTLIFGKTMLRKILFILVSFAVGGLFGGAFFHLIPESFEHIGTKLTSLYIIFGIVLFFVLEKFIHWRHCHADEDQCKHPLVSMIFVGDGVHNFIDGLLIGASYLVDLNLGIATTIAIVFHEIPQEIGDFGVFIHGGCNVKCALLYNFLSALFAVVGTIIALLIGAKISSFSEILVPIAAGGFIYIAGSDLIPELKHNIRLRESALQFIAIVFGLAIMFMISHGDAGHTH